MSFQYINPNYPNIVYSYNQNTGNQTPVYPSYAQNPYDTSIYNNSVAFPYNPLYMPNLSAEYTSLGQITSPSGDIVYLFKLKNGQKIAIMPKKDEATIVKTFLNGGSMNETDDIRGISHCIEHCLFKGSSKLNDGDVFRLTSLMGASTNASTDFAQTDYYITAPFMDENNLAKTIEIQGDMISNPTFDKNAIESEKGPICSEISMINDDAITVAFDKVIRNLFQIKSDSKNLVAGSIETVSNLSKDAITNHHQTYYDPKNLNTVVIGDVDVNKTINEIAKNFTLKPVSNQTFTRKEVLTPLTTAKREDIRSSKTNYTSVILGFAGPKPKDSKDFIISQMINYYLSNCSTSDLKNALEKMNGDYSTTCQKVGLNDYDPYALISVIGVNPKDEQKGLDAFYDAIQKLQNYPLNDNEISAIQTAFMKDLEYKMANSSDICDLLGGCMLDDSLDLFTNYKTLAKSITKEDIMNFARKYYDLNKASIVVVHPMSVSEEDIKLNYNNSKYSFNNVQNNSRQIAFKGTKSVTVDNVKEYKLNNNTHIALNDSKSDLCVFKWSVDTPPIKPKNPNIPAVLSYIFQKGTLFKNQSEIERYKELNGIDTNIYVNGKSIEITADCLSESVEKTLGLMNELLYHPNFSNTDFENAKRYVKDSLNASQKDATSNLLDNLYPGYFPTKAQMLKTIDELTIKDVEEFYQELLKNASSTLVATAPFSKNQTLENTIINYQMQGGINFKDSTPKLTPLFEANKEANVIYDTDDLNQAQIYKSYKFPLSGNIEDEAKFELVNMILGGGPNSRLFSDLREKQNLAYSVSSTIQSFENTGILTLKIQTTTDHKDQGVTSYDNVKKSLEGFNKHINKLQTEYVSDEELEGAKMRLKQNVIGMLQMPDSETELLMMNAREPYGIKRIDKYLEAIDKITKEDVLKSAQFIFSYNPTTSILASKDTINSQMEYLKTQGKLEKAS